MNRLPLHLYQDWRHRHFRAFSLRETTPQPQPPERLLQAIWHHQRLLREQLRTLDGRLIRVLHPGFRNCEAGPDFRGAVIQFEGESPRVGDVEIDLRPGFWKAHRHEENISYTGVLLHVVWESGETPNNSFRILALKSCLDASLADLNEWLSTEAARQWPDALAGQCSAAFKTLAEPVTDEVLAQAGLIRLRAKASQIEARARQAGWDQAFWEALFRALGYKHNPWPMQRLAELLPHLNPPENQQKLGVIAWQAKLLGVGGLLPADAPTGAPACDRYIKQLWDFWWRERDSFMDVTLPRQIWRFSGLRPGNHPQRRLALAAHWLAEQDLLLRLEKWFSAAIPDDDLADSLSDVFQTGPDDFWSHYWTFRSRPAIQPHSLLGAMRVTDLAMNVVLPWFWMRAEAGHQEKMRQLAIHRYLAWPAGEDNSVLRLARQRLLGGMQAKGLSTAARQQGLHQIVRDFCDRSNALCTDCGLPGMLTQLCSAKGVAETG